MSYDFVGESDELIHLELGDTSKYNFRNPFEDPSFLNKDETVNSVIAFIRDPNYLAWFCKNFLKIEILPFQAVILKEMWTHPFPMLIATRGGSKSFMLALYITCRAVLDQGCKICVVGAALRQAMLLFNYINSQIWDGSTILQDICGGQKHRPKREIHTCTWKVGNSEVKFLPMGNGETIRGQRATITIVDEFASIDPEIFETVVRGFAAVRSQGLISGVKHKIRHNLLKSENIDLAEVITGDGRISTKTNLGCNQIVIAGTTSYSFNHFYKYYTYYKAIIESNGDQNYLKKNYPDMKVSSAVNPHDYCVIRLPYDMLPPGFMDEAILAQGQATMNSTIFDQEYGCIFPTDSDGFYLASSVYNATCPVKSPNGDIMFGAELAGDHSYSYAMGIDPASESDNFAICILQLDGFSRKIVYQWTTNRKKFTEMKAEGLINSEISDYHTFCVRHIRDLLKRFNIVRINCDFGGGGISIKEGLQDKTKAFEGEPLIYDMDDELVAGNQGSYILRMVKFNDSEWYKSAHYGLKKDLTDIRILFPKYDTLAVAECSYSKEFSYETIEDIYEDIEEMKREIILIRHEQTPSGQERWDVPKLTVKASDETKKSLKKDRFTSLLLANWCAREIEAELNNTTAYEIIGRSRGSGINKSRPTSTIPKAMYHTLPGGQKLRQVATNLGATKSVNRGGQGV